MRDARLFATLIVWSATTVMLTVLVVLLNSTASLAWWINAALLFIVLTLIAISGTSTQAIWTSRRSEDDPAELHAKTKRLTRSRIEQLVEDLNDDEVYELEELLLQHDRESASPQRGR